ncbi:hypothetical protein ACIGHN_07575 [Acidovorax sp. NPDC077693]|uniref:hypothetical protein n=1 Tax=Acidovorax sp. NPDC077693 TaxID=3363889 RepID=UPI0037C71399
MTMDIANLSETMRQGEATRAALGVQLRTRPLWSGAGRFTGAPVRFINPYRMRPVNSPEYLFENIVHNGAVYMADGQTSTGNATVYTGTDLKAWVARNAGASEALVAGKMLAAGSLLFTVTSYAGNSFMKTSVDNGVTWVYQGGGANGMSFSSAGGYIYGLSGTGTTAFQTMSAAAPAPANRNFATARGWNKVLHNGARWLALGDLYTAAEWSANGLDGWASAAGYAAAMDAMPSGTRSAFTVGGRFVVVSVAAGAISTAYSDNATAWSVGALGEMEPTGLRVNVLGSTAAEMGGVLYIPVKLTDGTNFWNALLATADGIKFKWLPPFWRGAEALPSISAKAGGTGLIFNAASTGVTAAHRFETNPDAQEVYLAV